LRESNENACRPAAEKKKKNVKIHAKHYPLQIGDDKMQRLNYYEILGVSSGAETKEIKKAYRRMAELHHPDKMNTNDVKLIELATEEMILINEAKDILLDDQTRRKYDLEMQNTSYISGRQEEENALVKMIVQSQNVLSSIGECGVDIKEAEKYFFQAKYAFQNRYYRNGLELLQYAVRSARDAHYQFAVREILAARNRILAVAEEGYNVDFAKNILIQAKPAIEDGNYEQATEFAKAAVKASKKIKETEKEITRQGYTPPSEEDVFAATAASPKSMNVSWDAAPVSEKEKMEISITSAKDYVDHLTEDEFNEVKILMAEKEKEIRMKKRLERDFIKIEIASRYKDIMKRFQEYQRMEEETIHEILERYEGGKKDEMDFDLDLGNMEFIDDKDIPKEDKEVIGADWDEAEKTKKKLVYKSVLTEAWADGVVTEDEEAMLEQLRASLDLPIDEHQKMEEDIIKKLLLNNYL
jgi:curved DNA-binding protein CbpA